MTREDVGREILRLVEPEPGCLAHPGWCLGAGKFLRRCPLCIPVWQSEGGGGSFVADKEAAPRVVRLDDIADHLSRWREPVTPELMLQSSNSRPLEYDSSWLAHFDSDRMIRHHRDVAKDLT